MGPLAAAVPFRHSLTPLRQKKFTVGQFLYPLSTEVSVLFFQLACHCCSDVLSVLAFVYRFTDRGHIFNFSVFIMGNPCEPCQEHFVFKHTTEEADLISAIIAVTDRVIWWILSGVGSYKRRLSACQNAIERLHLELLKRMFRTTVLLFMLWCACARAVEFEDCGKWSEV
jgi:hypothetical protein